MKIQTLANNFVVAYEAYRFKSTEMEAKIESAELRLEELKNERKALSYPSWIDTIIWPIAKELGEQHFPDYDIEVLGPFGICAEVPIHFYRKGIPEKERWMWVEGNIKSVCLIPGELQKGEILIRDRSIDTGEYKPGTIAEINGMNHPSVKIPEDAEVSYLLQWVK